MKLYCLNNDPSKPCYALEFKSVLLMLDCGLSLKNILNFLPSTQFPGPRLKNLLSSTKDGVEGLCKELKECQEKIFIDSNFEFCPPLTNLIEFSQIDAILVSNYSLILALPFITEDTGFRGLVYATEPTLFFGRLILQELVEYLNELPQKVRESVWKDFLHLLPATLSDVNHPKTWKPICSLEQVEKSLSKVKIIGFDEDVNLFGALRIRGVSSGYRLGSCNWLISTEYEKIVYISSSSTLTTHPKVFDKSLFFRANALILTGLRQKPTTNPETTLGELCMNVALTVRNGGCVLLPCYPFGVVYDLFECVSSHLETCNLTSVPIFFIAPAAEVSLAYSIILGEWLSESKQDKLYVPEEPFPHTHLVKNGRLKYFKKIYSEGLSAEYKEPCIIFCGHPSLRFGEAVHFIEQWGSNPLHTLILTGVHHYYEWSSQTTSYITCWLSLVPAESVATLEMLLEGTLHMGLEPDFDFSLAIAPFQPLSMKVIYCPIDTSLNFSQANRLLQELRPTTLIVPTAYTKPPPQFPKRPDLMINQGLVYVQSLECGEAINVPMKRQFVKATLSPLLADRLTFSTVKPGFNLAAISGRLVAKDNAYEILPDNEIKRMGPKNKFQYEYGQPDLEQFLMKVEKSNLPPVTMVQKSSEVTIHFGEQATVHFMKNATDIVSHTPDPTVRTRIRKILLECISSF